MANVEKLHLEGANLDRFAGLHGAQIGLIQVALFGQFDFQHPAGQGSGVDGRLNFIQYVANSAGMVFVAVGNDDAAHFVAFVEKIREIRNDVIHAQHIAVGEQHTSIDD